MNAILANLIEQYDVRISKSHLRRILKEIGFKWKRMRKSLKEDRNQEEFDNAKKEIKDFEEKHRSEEIELCYFDGSHFSLTPSVPYGWQKTGEEITLPSKKGGQQNVLGLLNLNGELKSLIFETKIDSETVIFSLNEFFKYKRQDKKIVVIIDNAPVHKSEAFEEAIVKWKERNIEFYFLPPYSPELNKIEILWRFIKYSWLSLEAYVNKSTLLDSLCDVLKNVGCKYRVTFS